jgi:hypothetical protein
MPWELRYMETLVAALGITSESNVLEIGWGCGYSAAAIQSCKPLSYTVIECDSTVIARAEAWSSEFDNVTIVAGYWQHVLSSATQLKGRKFDAIFFDDFPLPLQQQQQQQSADNDVSTSINDSTYNTTAHDTTSYGDSRWHQFIQSCLTHLSLHGRITGYMARPIDLNIAGFTVDISMTPVDVPEHCPYFPYTEACVPVITWTGTSEMPTRAAKRRKMHELVLNSLGLDP